MRINDKVQYVSRIIVGAAFVASAILKFLSLEAFELYIYGFDWFGMALSCYAARMILAAEMFMGLSLLSGVKAKFSVRAAMATLVVFSLFLLYLIITGNEGNCHCFGEQFELKPLPSLGKNVVLMALLFLAWRSGDWLKRVEKYLLPVLVIASLVFALFLKLPYGLGKEREVRFIPEKYAEMVESHPVLQRKGKQVVAFFSTSCKHCKSAMRKLEIALRHHDFPKERIQWFVLGSADSYHQFLEETGVEECPNELMNFKDIFAVTDGSFPLILLVKDGEVVGKLSNATFKEELIDEFCEAK